MAVATALKFALTSAALAGVPETKVFGMVTVSGAVATCANAGAPVMTTARAVRDFMLLISGSNR
jgi:hypothetical protein